MRHSTLVWEVGDPPGLHDWHRQVLWMCVLTSSIQDATETHYAAFRLEMASCSYFGLTRHVPQTTSVTSRPEVTNPVVHNTAKSHLQDLGSMISSGEEHRCLAMLMPSCSRPRSGHIRCPGFSCKCA